ncbi:hypothetical protein CXB51_008376 [Gossypium anomalum]|uniref:DUF4283 domain-containing protein n=1 Tax=Gossypium anomalum TaxID=47600 RepID=A0A8J5YZZ5_9ROSI|nr:hypothetical protein CXB51_008376 [Gossypium anomalum]
MDVFIGRMIDNWTREPKTKTDTQNWSNRGRCRQGITPAMEPSYMTGPVAATTVFQWPAGGPSVVNFLVFMVSLKDSDDVIVIKDDEEEEIIHIQKESDSDIVEEYLCLTGCFLTANIIHFPAMRSTMANLWHSVKGVQISDLGEKRFLFRFFHIMDLERVLKGSPWTFNNHLLILHQLMDGDDPLKVPLIYTNFWVQIHEIPLRFFSEALARQIGGFIGKFIEYDGHSDSFCHSNMELGFEVTEMGWNLSIRAQSRRALAMNRVNLERNLNWVSNVEVGSSKIHEQTEIEHDGKDGVIEGGDGKKRPRREDDRSLMREETSSLVLIRRRGLEKNLLVSMAAKRQVDRSQ